MAEPPPPRRTDSPAPDLVAAWQLLMGLVLDQRMQWADIAQQLGITQAGLRALLAIDPAHPRPQRELAQAIDCDPSYVTAMVDDLERAGLAQRRTAAADRRVKTIALTEPGIAALEIARDGLFAPPRQFDRLTAKQQHTLARLLRLAVDGGEVAPT